MFAALLTTFFFALSGVTGQRTAVRLGGLWGNFVRLLIAVAVLGIVVAFAFPGSVRGPSFSWFLASGAIGFGLGDIALFLAYERIGSRLTILLNLCMAPLFAMLVEWLWLGNAVTQQVVGLALLILVGVALAVRPGERIRSGKRKERRGSFPAGIVFALMAGFGQGAGAVVSRKAEEVAASTGVEVSGISAAFQRGFAGLVVAAVAVLGVRLLGRREWWKEWRSPFDRKLAPWLLGAALFGPVIGVSCFQWALQSESSGVVLAVVAATPIVMMPLSALTEGDRPTPLAVLGAVVAVAGVVLLYLQA